PVGKEPAQGGRSDPPDATPQPGSGAGVPNTARASPTPASVPPTAGPPAHQREEAAAGGLAAALRVHAKEGLSEREVEVALLALRGLSTREIALSLHLSENTVKTHLRNVYRKTGSAGRHDLYRRLLPAESGPWSESEPRPGPR
ncbi:MAG: helix-turn-helix transcriptional regulator, partial [Clostridia bacterium]|nr:helix-turn-helix transcriptional regulator [Clostridia bacterium]